MRISREILNRVEGEVELKLRWKDGRVEDAFVVVPNFRGFEKILIGRPYLDALVITPRVCGICGHSHLMATVRALESAYASSGIEVRVSDKASRLRRITQLSEIVQNHIRWFYLYFMPDFVRANPTLEDRFSPLKGSAWREALEASNRAVKVIALFGGQWPHTSYALPGGVMSDPTGVEVGQALILIDSLIRFFEERVVGMPVDDYLSLSYRDFLGGLKGDLGIFVSECMEKGLDREGRSYGRFIVGGEIEGYVKPGAFNRRECRFDLRKVKESEEFTFTCGNGKAYTWAKAARYRGLPFEAGPLARQMLSRDPLVKELYRRFGDSVMVRVFARMRELVRLLLLIKEDLKAINLKEPSWERPPVDTKTFSGRGVGVVEASRGTLIHEVVVEEGRIKSYNIITPTVWNLGPRDGKNLGVVEKALLGLDSPLKAQIVLRSFDVCSVCTSH